MQRIGVNVWPLNTVQFSNHTQYGQWTGEVLPSTQISALVEGVANPKALYLCDPVMGHPEKGCSVLGEVSDFLPE